MNGLQSQLDESWGSRQVHANVHNHFNQERHLVDRQTYKERRSAALAEWQLLMA